MLAALGPKMLGLAAARAAGVHPYLVTTEHTRMAREAVGADGLVATEQGVVLERDPVRARGIARQALVHPLGLSNYRNSWKRLGFTDDDLADGGSDRPVDAVFAWGDDDAIARRIVEHRDAGADHVCIQVLGRERSHLYLDEWRHLAPALVSFSDARAGRWVTCSPFRRGSANRGS